MVVADSEQASKTMRLRYAGRCRICVVALAKGDLAVFDPTDRKVLCLPCAGAAGRGIGLPTNAGPLTGQWIELSQYDDLTVT